ncbi:hypothetical protein J0X15_13605 [Roseibium sp. CAU 1637]|uniref:Uncharacterized protein n=1 Tax=Roseibium limicola TaxID=2816037 RepID=A0A939ESF0_9HYPH|nr:hypothetical protein [Roseibium limicola]MBO0346264.1 hypothetical protein [Roseibium limicola]
MTKVGVGREAEGHRATDAIPAKYLSPSTAKTTKHHPIHRHPGQAQRRAGISEPRGLRRYAGRARGSPVPDLRVPLVRDDDQ